jgi:hypothetical protein
MKNLIKATLIVAILTLVLPGCKKFEDGPAFSLRTVKARVTGTWHIDNVSDNGVDATAAYQAFISSWVIDKSGSYTINEIFGNETGTWKLGEDKDDILFTKSGSSTVDSYRILRCKNKELWLRQVYSNGTKLEIKLKQ